METWKLIPPKRPKYFYKDRFSRATYREYVEDLLQSETEMLMMGMDVSEIPQKEYAFHDVDGNGEKELLIKRNGKIGSIVGMKDGKTNEGKSYDILLYEGNVLIDHASGPGDFLWYHIFRFANDGDPVFSPQKGTKYRSADAEGRCLVAHFLHGALCGF